MQLESPLSWRVLANSLTRRDQAATERISRTSNCGTAPGLVCIDWINRGWIGRHWGGTAVVRETVWCVQESNAPFADRCSRILTRSLQHAFAWPNAGAISCHVTDCVCLWELSYTVVGCLRAYQCGVLLCIGLHVNIYIHIYIYTHVFPYNVIIE